MIAERIVGLAMRAYPSEVRNARGDEMLDTVLDVSDRSKARLLRETMALARAGFGARATVACAAGNRRLAFDVCAQAATATGLLILIICLRADRVLYDSHAHTAHEVASFSYQAFLAIAIAAALIGYDRISALFGLAWIGVLLQYGLGPSPFPAPVTWPIHWVAIVSIPLMCYLVMLLAPRARRVDRRRLLWLALAAGLGLALPASLGLGYGSGFNGTMLLLLLLTGLCMLPAGPKVPLAFAVVLIVFGLAHWTLRVGAPSSEVKPFWLIVTVAGPILLMAGAALRLSSTRRSVVG
jgi:hypothetical protein